LIIPSFSVALEFPVFLETVRDGLNPPSEELSFNLLISFAAFFLTDAGL